jgi:hypothetical protein
VGVQPTAVLRSHLRFPHDPAVFLSRYGRVAAVSDAENAKKGRVRFPPRGPLRKNAKMLRCVRLVHAACLVPAG